MNLNNLKNMAYSAYVLGCCFIIVESLSWDIQAYRSGYMSSSPATINEITATYAKIPASAKHTFKTCLNDANTEAKAPLTQGAVNLCVAASQNDASNAAIEDTLATLN